MPSRGRKTLRAFLLCHQCCKTECVSPLPLEGRSPAEGFCAGLLFEHSLPHRGNDSLDSQVAHAPLQHGYHRLTIFCASLTLLHTLLSLTHWIFGSLMLPYKSSSHSAKYVRCASLLSGGRRLAVRTAMEHPIGTTLPRTPFASSRRSPQGETRKLEVLSYGRLTVRRCVQWCLPASSSRARECAGMGVDANRYNDTLSRKISFLNAFLTMEA